MDYLDLIDIKCKWENGDYNAPIEKEKRNEYIWEIYITTF